MNSLTILVPVYNEEASLPAFVSVMNRFLLACPYPTQVLFIDDGSTDGSLPLLKKFMQGSEAYRVVALDRNYGLSAAIKAGIDYADSEWIGYIDADLQTTPMDFFKFFDHVHSAELITGIRVKRNDKFMKRLSSKVANSVRSRVIGDGIKDTGCPLKLIKTDYAKNMLFYKGFHRFIPALIQLQGGRTKEIPVSHFPRSAGSSKFTLGNRMMSTFVDMLAFLWIKKRFLRYSIKDTKKAVHRTHLVQ